MREYDLPHDEGVQSLGENGASQLEGNMGLPQTQGTTPITWSSLYVKQLLKRLWWFQSDIRRDRGVSSLGQVNPH